MDLSTKKVSYHTNQIYAICQDVHAAEFLSLANEIIHVDIVIGARLRHFSRSITSTQNMLHLWRIFQAPYSRPSRRLSFWIWCSSMSCGVIQNRLSDGRGTTGHLRSIFGSSVIVTLRPMHHFEYFSSYQNWLLAQRYITECQRILFKLNHRTGEHFSTME